MLAIRQGRRLKFPGKPRVIVLFHPRQFYLARALGAHHGAELWYVVGAPLDPHSSQDEEELGLLDQRAREVAEGIVHAGEPAAVRSDNELLRERLVELEIISHKPFVPGARIGR
jgi:hypothetical protein